MGEFDEHEVRRRFHEHANSVHKLEARVLMAEGAIHILERDVKNAATLITSSWGTVIGDDLQYVYVFPSRVRRTV